MFVNYSYRGNKVEVCDFNNIHANRFGQVIFKRGYSDSDGNNKVFKAVVEPHELLKTAKECLDALNTIAGTKYKVVNYEL
jgi:hypothetical protein